MPKKTKISSKRSVAKRSSLVRGPNSSDRMSKLEKALQLHLDFLSSLPHGWLAQTCGDIGLLNQAYIASRDLGMKLE